SDNPFYSLLFFFFFFNSPPSTAIYTLSLHDALPIFFGYNYKPGEYGKFRDANPNCPLFGSETASCVSSRGEYFFPVSTNKSQGRSEEHTSELQSLRHLVCRLLLEKKKINKQIKYMNK